MKGQKLKGSLILALVMLVAGVLVMFILLNYSNKLNKAKVSKIDDVITLEQSTTKVEDITTDRLPDVEDNPNPQVELNVQNFSASLEEITYNNNDFSGNYKNEILYQGAMFNFVCTNYDEGNNKCTQGAGSMNTGKIVLPIYTYSNDEENVTTRLYDVHILVTDNYIIITNAIAGKKAGSIKMYDKDGNFKSEIQNVVTGYYEGEELLKQFYPILSDDNQDLYYQICSNNSVKATGVKLDNPGVEIEQVNIDGARCY